MALDPGIYYPSKNSYRQMLYSLPGSKVYPRDTNYIPFSESPFWYVNYAPVTGAVSVYVNGVLAATVSTVNAAGLYACQLLLPLGSSDVRSVFQDSTEVTQTFISVNLYSLVYAAAAVWSGFRLSAITAMAGLSVTTEDAQIFPGRVPESAIEDNFGLDIGFPQPSDWPSTRYLTTLGGNAATGQPGVYPALRKGASVGAIKDVVYSVTGYESVDADFRLLQYTGWQLPGKTTTYIATTADALAGTATITLPLATTTKYMRVTLSGEAITTWVLSTPTQVVVTASLTLGQEITVFWSPGPRFRYTKATAVSAGASYVFTLSPAPIGTAGLVVKQNSVVITTWSLVGSTLTVTGLNPGDTIDVYYVWDTDGNPAAAGYAERYLLGGASPDGYSPEAKLQSGIMQAFTIGLRVITDGFFVGNEVHVRGSGGTDKLNYTWLNPWATYAGYSTSPMGSGYYGSTGPATTFTIPAVVANAEVYVNGQFEYPSEYTLTPGITTTVLTFNVGIVLQPTDIVQVFYETSASPRYSQESTAVAGSSYSVVLTHVANPAGISVFVSGGYQDNASNHWVYDITTHTVTIHSTFLGTEHVCINYYTYNSDFRASVTGVYDGATFSIWNGSGFTTGESAFVFASPLDPNSIKLYVNGEIQAPGFTVLSADGMSVTLSGIPLLLNDIVTVVANRLQDYGYTSRITYGNTIFYQGTHYHLNYTTGEILWLYPGVPGLAPDAGSTYAILYTYFPMDILNTLIGVIKPATMCVRLRFTTTTGGHTFIPWTWGGISNPTGNVIA